ncbi:hypothetical protein MNB_SUP05-SYMBIONT-7-290 [hydrothermal vent metagenome]|uniref:Uncharacterized protein n=1 Tax=hydrothermal vent metagenome TaxID=652676 RepID=A0A1W1E253_9ZZZZ
MKKNKIMKMNKILSVMNAVDKVQGFCQQKSIINGKFETLGGH